MSQKSSSCRRLLESPDKSPPLIKLDEILLQDRPVDTSKENLRPAAVVTAVGEVVTEKGEEGTELGELMEESMEGDLGSKKGAA